MTKRNTSRLLLLVLAVLASSCDKIAPINAPTQGSGRADFSVVAALGTSITAGFQSGGLVDRHQAHSYASLFAAQAFARTLDLPLFDGAGHPQLLEIKRLVPPPVQIGPIDEPEGVNTNSALPTAYHNMAVPGALLKDMVATAFTSRTDTTFDANYFFGEIVRDRGSIARQIADLDPKPTFLLLEFGTTELLAPALRGTNAGLLPTAVFADSLVHALDTLTALLPGIKMAVLNVPDVTGLPFFTTLSNKELDRNGRPQLDGNGRPKFLLGPGNVPLTANDLVLLSARSSLENGYGYRSADTSYLSGLPVAGQGAGLSAEQILSATEVAALQERGRRFNGVIDTAAASIATPREIAIVDFDGLLRRARTGIELRRVVYTTTFVTGGLMSLDAVHPNDLAHALLCNEVIQAVNRKFGATLSPIDPLRFATGTASRAGGSREAGGPIPAP